MTSKTFFKLFLGALFVAAVIESPASTVYPSPNGGLPIVFGQQLFSNGGDVTVTFLGPTGASYDEHLFVSTPTIASGPAAAGAHFFDDHATANGVTVDLGVIPNGTEIVFGLFVDTTGDTFFDGPAGRNPDNFVHAFMVNNYPDVPNSTYVGFEDLNGLGFSDWNYVDEVFAFTNTIARVNPAPEASTTLSLFGLGLLGLALLARRFRQ
jgi:hypothetical protein